MNLLKLADETFYDRARQMTRRTIKGGIRCPSCKAKVASLPCVSCLNFCPECKVFTGGGKCGKCRARGGE